MLIPNSVTIRAKDVRSLCFHGDQLVDWVGGARVFDLDGTDHGRRVNFAYRFDQAISSPDGRFTVIYERLGTKALLLERGRLVRELNRSFYCADAFEYPVHLFRLADGATSSPTALTSTTGSRSTSLRSGDG
ncbi:MAG: hypothetical protein JOZ69_07690 [Myxococcales bacterium]|nr:hypothetical protein [Myxococcales bacterium]